MQRLSLALTILVLDVVLVASCKGPRNPNHKSAEPTSRIATLSEQKMCADQAGKIFNESEDERKSTFTNHYDPTGGVCYIEVTTREWLPQEFSYNLMVYDAFEGRIYGEYGDHLPLQSSTGPKLDKCSVKPREQAEITCKSRDEFNDLALRFFGTTPD